MNRTEIFKQEWPLRPVVQNLGGLPLESTGHNVISRSNRFGGVSNVYIQLKGESMQSKANDVSDYLQEVPERRLEALTRLRAACLDILEGYEEGMDYGMPSYKKDGTVEVAFASQKSYISFYIMKEGVLDEFRSRLSGVSLGKGCIRYTKPEKIDFDVVEQLLRESYLSKSEVC